MSKIVWDAVGERYYETGTKNCVLYPQVNGAYPMGYAWNGITAISESPSGADATALWADDMKYLELRAAEEFGGTIEAYTYPDEFMPCDGSVEASTGIVLGQQKRKPFGLCYRTVLGNDTDMDDHGYKLHLVYNATANPSERSYQTVNDSPEAITFSWEFTTTPIAVGTNSTYKNVSCITIDSTKVDPDDLQDLLDALYGTDAGSGTTATDPYLPSPAAVLAFFVHQQLGN